MTALALNRGQRRGACPGLSEPMPTGDGLLVRLRPVGTVALDAFAGLCAAARLHGNGVIEITARGSMQIRGLSLKSAPHFADAVKALGIAAEDGVPIVSNPLAGLDPDEILDPGVIAANLRDALQRTSLAKRLAPKVSVVIDGGGKLTLDTLAADVRLCADTFNGTAVFRIGVAGDGASARELCVVVASDGIEFAVRLIETIAQRGRDARARDILAAEGAAAFRSAVADLRNVHAPPRGGRPPGEAVGIHRLRDASVAYGVGFAFGHADGAALEKLVEAAGEAGGSGVRAAPGRVLLIVGINKDAASAFAVDAEKLGFIVRAADSRRRVVACSGAPICNSGHIAARALAPRIAETVAPIAGESFTLHISGCAKGCAHTAPATLTVVGTPDGCALVADGTAHDEPFSVVSVGGIAAAIAGYLHTSGRSHV